MIGLDFESFGAVSLPQFGLHRYVNNKTFTPLLAATAVWDGVSVVTNLLDFTEDYEDAREQLILMLGDELIVAHNAGFEQAVLGSMGIHVPSQMFIDSAVLARAAGAAGKLEVAGPQLLGIDKQAVGADLIKLFSIPGKYQEESGSMYFDPRIKLEYPKEWAQFGEYCGVDAELSLRLAMKLMDEVAGEEERINNAVTMDMNNVGWRVDLAAVEEMERRYLRNIEEIVENFRQETGAWDLNLNSQPQLTTWCIARGVKSLSFDEAHVEKLIKSVDTKLARGPAEDKATGYLQVRAMLHTKQALGGSSLKKLRVILDTTGEDGRLHDQYLHIGAAATYRTTGRGVQMQNLKRLNGGGSDMSGLFDLSIEWDNGELASNLRQVFTASDPKGQLVVGDFASVESRGLAWQSGEQWKLDAYHQGQDLYKVQAGKIFGKPADQVTKDERQIGKVGELACGYGAGPDAVKSFAEKMGVILSEGESAKLVQDWRAANKQTVQYWYALDDALHAALDGHIGTVSMLHGSVDMYVKPAPQSLRDQVGNPDLMSLHVDMLEPRRYVTLSRVIHGVHLVGRNVQYWKPSERKTGNLWSDEFTNPKTKRLQKHSVYGGKLAGLLTQSLCREVFFTSLREVHEWVSTQPNVQLVGQFHDEVVLDWVPGKAPLAHTKAALEQAMTYTALPEFPLAAEIKSDYRYTK